MDLAEAGTPPATLTGRRFSLVGYLPTYGALLFLLVLVWSGAPGGPIHLPTAWRTAASLKVGELVMLVLAVTVISVLLQPLQLGLVRLLEGDWPDWLSAVPVRYQRWRRGRLWRAAELPCSGPWSAERVNRAGVAGTVLRRRFPLPDHLVRPTALGNVLCAMEDTAGRGYGLDAVVAWPRLYPVLGSAMKSIVDDRRDALDLAARLTVTGAVTAVAATALLVRSGWWLLLALVPIAVAVLGYAGAVRAALGYAESVHAAFDLHRFDLLRALGLAMPAGTNQERVRNRALCDFWRQGVPTNTGYSGHGVRREDGTRAG